MKIREYAIRRYGPLRDTGRVQLSGFNLIYGNNEDGKTLTIDALVKLLLGKLSKERDFKAIGRVDELPEGYIVIRDRDDREYKLPEHGTLTSIAELSAGECSNIFVIRNSDLSIPNEQAFYTSVTERLTGLRTRYIGTVINSLRTIGNITPTGIFRDVGEERLKSRIDDADRLIETIDELIAECKSQDLDRAEERIVEITGRLKTIAGRLDLLNEARLRERYEKGTEALGKLIDARDDVASIEGVNEDDLQKWRDNERDIERLTAERAENLEILENNRKELESSAGELKEDEAEWSRMEEQKRRLDEVIRPLIKQHEELRVSVPRYETRRKFFNTAGLLTGILFGISLIGLLLAPGTVFYIITAVLFFLLLVSGALSYISVRTLSGVSVDFGRLNSAAARYGLDAENLPRILEKIETFEDRHRRISDELQEQRRQMQNLQELVGKLSHDTIPNIDREIQTRMNGIDSIRNASGQETLESYRQTLRRRTEYRNQMETQAALLRSDFGDLNDSVNENILYWQNKIRELQSYKDTAPGIEYDETALSKLTEERKKLKEELESLDKLRSGIAERMKEVGRKANRILQSGDEYLFCKTMDDLAAIRSMLEEFIGHHQSTRENVLCAIEIFSSIQEDELKKVGALFGEERPVSKYFAHITGGRYSNVLYDRTNGRIEIEMESGDRLPAGKLSGGAYDQLYFAVRIGLGEELLKGDTGFFILDDPFIKSDIGRLHEQMAMLREIADRGWQILFFSAKAEVLETLEDDIDRNRVKLIDYRENV